MGYVSQDTMVQKSCQEPKRYLMWAELQYLYSLGCQEKFQPINLLQLTVMMMLTYSLLEVATKWTLAEHYESNDSHHLGVTTRRGNPIQHQQIQSEKMDNKVACFGWITHQCTTQMHPPKWKMMECCELTENILGYESINRSH